MQLGSIRENEDPGPSRMCADVALARQKLGYQPRVNLEEGLRTTIIRDTRFQPPAEQG